MLCLRDYEEYAKKHLDHKSWAFISQGAEREITLRENISSFNRYMFIPRMLRNKPERDLSVTVLGERISMPVGLAPAGYQKLAHYEGEIAASKAASEAGTIYALSTVATSSIEDVARNQPKNTPLWFQVYLLKDRSATEEMILKAEAEGYKALVLTVDAPRIGLQLKIKRSDVILPPHVSIPNYKSVRTTLESNEKRRLDYGVNVFDTNLNWGDVTWIKRLSHLPLVIKGILTVDDALEAVKHGASAVWISNHGGRQLDGVSHALDVLPEIAEALSGSGCEIYIDGGIRWGTDILKAVALGARVVFIGRPIFWGLNHSGQDGVRSILEILRAELDLGMLLAGCSSIKDVGPNLVKKRESSKL